MQNSIGKDKKTKKGNTRVDGILAIYNTAMLFCVRAAAL